MNDLNVIDSFMAAFIAYIDSGFGLLSDDVAYLTTILVGIDIALAGLFWAMDNEANILARLIKKVLYVGVFAFLLNNFSGLADIVYRSFAGLGLHAAGGSLVAADLLKPGKLAGVGFQAAWPLLKQVGDLMGFTSFFDNFLTIAVLLIAWLIVIVAFFVLAVQLFITILEFKLTALAGFVLVPFALWNKTSFLAERVLGNVVSSGIKVMVLAVITGIGSGFFGQFTAALHGQEPDINQAMALVLASLALFGLGIFGPGIASGLVSGAPQLGAGAAIGTLGAAAGGAMLGGGAVAGGARLLGSGGLAAIRAGTSMGAAASTAYQLGQATSGASGVSVIAASLVTGLNSDLPGLVVAQVTENVFDSVTGQTLLIPQGARLIGSYDSVVAFGQSRALLVWRRIIMPDGSSIRIDNLPATDAAGTAGLEDGVDYHTWALLKGVVLSTLLGVGTELSLGANESDLVRAIRESTQQNADRAGQRITEKTLNIQPTLTVRPGWPLRVIVHQDLILRPYRG